MKTKIAKETHFVTGQIDILATPSGRVHRHLFPGGRVNSVVEVSADGTANEVFSVETKQRTLINLTAEAALEAIKNG